MMEADFDALNEHLNELIPIFDRFCAQQGFKYVPNRAIGRYPRIRIERGGSINLWFDLWMELDKNGQRFEKFRRDLPYELSAGASVVVQDDSGHRVRYQRAMQCFSGKPFDQVGGVLLNEMQQHLMSLKKWDVQHLKDCGSQIDLRT